jgi:hypothetical protein
MQPEKVRSVVVVQVKITTETGPVSVMIVTQVPKQFGLEELKIKI